MSELLRSNPEAEKLKTPKEIFNSFSDNFKFCWDVLHNAGDFSSLSDKLVNAVEVTDEITNEKTGEVSKEVKVIKTFNEVNFFEVLKKIHPTYLEHVKRLFEDDFANTPKIEIKLETKEQEQKRMNYLAEITKTFIKRIEFYSRLKPPETIIIGGKTGEQLITEMEQDHISISNYAREMMDNEAFTVTKKPEETKLVRFRIKDLDFKKNPTTDQIYKKITEFGLDLCSPEVGPHHRLSYKNQPLNEWESIGMKQIPAQDDRLFVFLVVHDAGGLRLCDDWTEPTSEWSPEYQVVFSLRK